MSSKADAIRSAYQYGPFKGGHGKVIREHAIACWKALRVKNKKPLPNIQSDDWQVHLYRTALRYRKRLYRAGLPMPRPDPRFSHHNKAWDR